MQLHIRDFGQGARPALALHCGLGQSGNWKGVAAGLDDLLRLRAADLPGHGRSPDWNGAGDYTTVCCDAVEAVLAGFSPDRPVDLIGHSFGGVVALMLTLRRRASVRSLTLIEPVLMKALPPAAHAAQVARMRPCADMLAAGDAPGAARLFLHYFGGGVDFDQLPPPVQQAIAARIHLVLASHPVVEDDFPGLTAPETLACLDLPVLLIEGTTSLDVHPAINATLANRLPNARRVVIRGAGHMMTDSHPQDVTKAIRDFLL